MNRRAIRVARGFVTGTFATVVAAVLHVSAGGEAPSVLALVLALVFAGLVSTALTGRRASLARLAVTVGLSQAAFHLGFSFLRTDATVASTVGGAHQHSISFLTPDVSGASVVPVEASLMWVAHLAAGALTIVFLRRAEASVWFLAVRAARLVVRHLAIVDPVPQSAAAIPAPSAPVSTAFRGRIAARPATRRGPPLALS